MIKNQLIHYEPIAYQAAFQESRAAKVYLSSGYGGGKTYSLCMKGLQLLSENAGFAGGLLCPTLKMFKRDVLPTFLEIFAENGIDYRYNKTDMFFYLPLTHSTLYVFHAEDDGDSIRGPNLAFGLINEVTMCSKGSFDAFLARIRVKKAPFRQLAMSGTPEGFNWTYKYFIEKPRADTDLIYGDMRLNRFVADSYAQELVDSYDAQMVKQYVGGQYVNINTNTAAWSFNRHKHTDANIVKNPLGLVWISLDFNINPMAATLWNRMPGLDGKPLLEAFEDIRIPSSNTHEMCRALKQRLEPDDEPVVYPDPAGNAGSTKSLGQSDIDILRQYGFKDIRFKARIASVRDCLNATNNLFDKNKIKINHLKCPNLVADLEQCSLKPGVFELDKKDGERTHWLDGMKDMIDYEFPVVKAGGVREHRIR